MPLPDSSRELREPKPLPAEVPYPLHARLLAWAWAYITWPWTVRQLRREGWTRVSWMTWSSGPGIDYRITPSGEHDGTP
jgi:hypothetical protein